MTEGEPDLRHWCYQSSHLRWGIWSLQSVSVRLVARIQFNLLNDPRFGMRSLQEVSHPIPSILFDFSELPCIGVRSLQFVSVHLVPSILFDFPELPALRCAISAVGECPSPAINSVWFCWTTRPSVCDLCSSWVSISCHQFCFIFLNYPPFGVRSLQAVSVYLVPSILIDFAELPALRCAISAGSECPSRAINSDWFCWTTRPSVCDFCRKWVISCHQFCLIFLNYLPSGVGSLQRVSVHLVQSILFEFWMTYVLLCDFSRKWVWGEFLEDMSWFSLMSAEGMHSSPMPCMSFSVALISLSRNSWLPVCELAPKQRFCFCLGSLVLDLVLYLDGHC
jgi:ferredoxin